MASERTIDRRRRCHAQPRRRRPALAQAGPLQFDAVGAMNDAIQQGVADRRIANEFMPPAHRNLAGEQQRTLLVSVVGGLQQIAPLLGGQRFRAPVVDDQQFGPLQHRQHPRQPAFTAGGMTWPDFGAPKLANLPIFRGHLKPLIALSPVTPTPSSHAPVGSGTGSEGLGYESSTRVKGGGSDKDDMSGGGKSCDIALVAITNASPPGAVRASGVAEISALPTEAVPHGGGRPEMPVPGKIMPGGAGGMASRDVEIWSGVDLIRLPGAAGIGIVAGHPSHAAPTAILTAAFAPRCA
jgi:hypothetical protein